MLQRILRKRTRVEKAAWEQVQLLMPRGRKTRGLQYIALDYLFTRLYEHVPEDDLRQHLLDIKGHLQPTGDPVKGAINSAIKELQRLPDRPFEIVKIQEATHIGQRRFVQLQFTRFEEVINFELYKEYLQEVLADESQIFLRGISSHLNPAVGELFPGLTHEDLGESHCQFLVEPHLELQTPPANLSLLYVPRSAANLRLLLIYEDQHKDIPFLGFVASHDQNKDVNDIDFILYRGAEKLEKLKFLDQLWRKLAQTARDSQQLERLKNEAQAAAQQLSRDQRDWYTVILDGLMAESAVAVSLSS